MRRGVMWCGGPAAAPFSVPVGFGPAARATCVRQGPPTAHPLWLREAAAVCVAAEAKACGCSEEGALVARTRASPSGAPGVHIFQTMHTSLGSGRYPVCASPVPPAVQSCCRSSSAEANGARACGSLNAGGQFRRRTTFQGVDTTGPGKVWLRRLFGQTSTSQPGVRLSARIAFFAGTGGQSGRRALLPTAAPPTLCAALGPCATSGPPQPTLGRGPHTQMVEQVNQLRLWA